MTTFKRYFIAVKVKRAAFCKAYQLLTPNIWKACSNLLLIGPAEVNKVKIFSEPNVHFRRSGVCFGRFYKSK